MLVFAERENIFVILRKKIIFVSVHELEERKKLCPLRPGGGAKGLNGHVC